jgi:molybdopterin molybdotransferase
MSQQTDNQLMVSVEEAERIILSNTFDFGVEEIDFTESAGRILAENVFAERDAPPFDRLTVDGIAIQYEAFANGIRAFRIAGIMAAGDETISVNNNDECIEVMTGASLPGSTDTVVRYEDLKIEDGLARINTDVIKRGQNIHYRGSDKKRGELIVEANRIVSPAVIAALVSNGKSKVAVKKLPRVLIISTGDEIVEVEESPSPFQIRSSNKHVIKSALGYYGITADTVHLRDQRDVIIRELKNAFEIYNVLIVTGGVSKGKFDFVPDALLQCGVKRMFHNVRQRPGKPFWFGLKEKKCVFAFPGNPVSVFMCMYRYMLPWLEKSLGLKATNYSAILSEDVIFSPSLQYFLPVSINSADGKIIANPVKTNGSGDFTNLLQADAFMELPIDKNEFKANEVYPIWPFEKII